MREHEAMSVMLPPRLAALSVALSLAACATAPAKPGPSAPAAPAAAPAPTAGVPDDPAAAVRYLEARVAATPADLVAWQRLAGALRRTNRLQEAARAGWRAVELAPTWESWSTLGNVLVQGQGRAGAWAAFEMSARERMDPAAVARSFLNIGYQDWALGRENDAAHAIDRAEKASPDSPFVHYDRANLLAFLGRIREARREAERAILLLHQGTAVKVPPRQSEVMEELLGRVLAGDRPTRPPLVDSGQVLPDRFADADQALGHALELAIDPDGDRVYQAGPGRLLRLKVPSRWNETTRTEREATKVVLVEDRGAAPTVLQLTILASTCTTPPRRGPRWSGAAADRSRRSSRSRAAAASGSGRPIPPASRAFPATSLTSRRPSSRTAASSSRRRCSPTPTPAPSRRGWSTS
jgi:tetratricopeptide (TPR) repeat protein